MNHSRTRIVLMSRFRLKGSREKSLRVKISRSRLKELAIGRFRPKGELLDRPRLNETQEEKARVTEKELEAVMSRDRPKEKELRASEAELRVNEARVKSLSRLRLNKRGSSHDLTESCGKELGSLSRMSVESVS